MLAKKIGAGLEAQNHCAEIKLLAERRMGGELVELEKNKGGGDHRSHDARGAPTLKEMGVNHNQSSRWQGIAALSDKVFTGYLKARRLIKAITVKRVEQRRFVLWWDQKKHGGKPDSQGGRPKRNSSVTLPDGIEKMALSRWRTSLSDVKAFLEQLLKVIERAAWAGMTAPKWKCPQA